MKRFIKHIIFGCAAILSFSATAQTSSYFGTVFENDSVDFEVFNGYPDEFIQALTNPVDSVRDIEELDYYLKSLYDRAPGDTVVAMRALPKTFFGPAVYESFEFVNYSNPFVSDFSGIPAMRWIEEENALAKNMADIKRALFFGNPRVVKYNINMLPEAPKQFYAVVNPEDHTIEFTETKPVINSPTIAKEEVQKKHWIRAFNSLLQFSQAYVSPNWYQGGNNNLNILADINYNVKLNQAYHPNLLFETTMQYKLGVNNAPDDPVRDYNISDDLLQITSTFGVKAAKRWYYSLTGVFKTQMVNSYTSGTWDMKSSFLSPGELTIGLGMTYNYANAKKTLTFDASIAPLSYDLKTCINTKMDETIYGIEQGRKFVQSFGSSAELRFFWQICSNISYTSRVFVFSNYKSLQADWENRFLFSISRFFTTQLYCNLRYDTSAPEYNDKWKKLQVKEILSIGFSYKFSTI